MLDAGATIYQAQCLLDHRDISTTAIYLHRMSDDQLSDGGDRPYES
jgi:site-specific recombinase XerD